MHTRPNPPPRSRYAAVKEYLAERGEPPYRLTQLLRAVLAGQVEFAGMRQLPRSLREDLAAEFGATFTTLRPLTVQQAPQVEKTLFDSGRGGRAESVLLSYRAGWTSLCLSTQVGCGLGCTFCATGTVGLVRNLTADEITDQVVHARARGPVDSVAFMGMGEALANPHTFTALRLLTDPALFDLSARRLTVSTVGFRPGMERLAEEFPQVVMTLSVHSPFPEQRSQLVPMNDRFGLEDCLAVLDRHVVATQRKVYLAYLLLDGVNDSGAHADALAGIVAARSRPDLFQVSLIPYNRAESLPADLHPSPAATIRRFQQRLRTRGVKVTRRSQFGTGIEAACGQLHARYRARAERVPVDPPAVR